ncbi:hypothetical protein LTR36_005294 [Oleoguttula mirabilis]|uniref:Uncharacterized protein n=1 Tax=Oleoguttula mirabilis TaxID=1507867 RepID=A0AAV9JEJ3_9PEZI|nr:hypothetical protein LTR36_005294 [Oleoguttula mirabilis]
MGIDPYANCNPQIVDNDLCTLETCCLAQSSFLYIPTYGGNLFFAVFFGVLLLPQLGLGIRYRTWGFMVGMIMGLVLEIIGYVARVQLHDSPFASNPFLMYLICLTIAPVFIAAAIYLCLTRIIMLYGRSLSRFAPRTIAIAFMSADFLSLVLQSAGGGIADTADANSTEQIGVDIMIAGLVLQALSLAVFLVVVADFAWCCSKGNLNMDPEKQRIRNRPIFKVFMIGLILSTLFVLIRSIFRAAELWGGFNGALWNNEVDFMVLDGMMIALATICLTGLHPGLAFGGQWHTADWSLKTKKGPEGMQMTDREYTPEAKP